MPHSITLQEGPFADQRLDLTAVPGDSIGLPVDEKGRPTNSDPFGLALYCRSATDASKYEFRIIKPVGPPFTVELVDGPGMGLLPTPQPARYMQQTILLPIGQDMKRFNGEGNPIGAAVYERRQSGDEWKYWLLRIDQTQETVDKMVNEVNDRRLEAAIRGFYVNPNYDIYSMKPTGEHVQVPVEVGYRRGHVDEKIAPLIKELWRLGMDTIGSCQERPHDPGVAGKAYVGFVRKRDALRFSDVVKKAGIDCSTEEKQIGLARNNPDGSIAEKVTIDSANAKFRTLDIDRVVEVLRDARV